jgi:hypothetical protein
MVSVEYCHIEAICATVNVSNVPSSMEGSDFVAFRLAAGAGFTASSDPKTYSGRAHLNLLLSMTDLRVREIERSTAAAREISQHQPRAKRGQVPISADMRYLPHMDIQTKREILQAAKREPMRHFAAKQLTIEW